jgi:uncharacterized protein YndB with AHSA1/START domain
MSQEPTGRITLNDDATCELILTRIFPNATAEDVWASITESERTARWYGPWRGTPGAGNSVEVQMVYEEGAPWVPMRIDACEPPTRLAISAEDGYGTWLMELRVRESASATALDLIQHRLDPRMAESVGPGWEYYMDMLVAARNDAPIPSFDDYYPGQSAYYAALANPSA